MPVRSHLTFANVASATALVVACAGGGVAVAAGLAKNSVGTAQLKDDAVVGAKVKNGSLSGKDVRAATLGKVPRSTKADTAGLADYAENVRWVVVDSTGGLVGDRSDGAVGASRLSAGRYAVVMERDVDRCAFVVSPSDPVAGNSSNVTISAHLEGATAESDDIYVAARNAATGAFTDSGFALVVVC